MNMKNVAFWDIRTQFISHRSYTHTRTGETGHPHHNKTVQGAEHNSSTEKKKANSKVQQVPSMYTA
jgi:hypothetical protein